MQDWSVSKIIAVFQKFCYLQRAINIEATFPLGNSAGGGDVWAKGLSVP